MIDEDRIRSLEAELGRQKPGTQEYLANQFELMERYGVEGRLEEAERILEELLQTEEPLAPKAQAAYVFASCIENSGDFERAISAYRRALGILSDPACMEPDSITAYFMHNNLGYSLNQVGSFQEGEAESRTAIEVAPYQYNAHKNLGVALEGQGRFAEAVHAYRCAIVAAPTEPRSRMHLEAMIEAHPELEQDPALAEEIMLARKALRLMIERARAQLN